MATTTLWFKVSLFVTLFVALVSTDVAKAQKNSGLAAALTGYLRPAAVAADEKIRNCNRNAATNPCSKILKTIVQDGSMSGLKSQLSIKQTQQTALFSLCFDSSSCFIG